MSQPDQPVTPPQDTGPPDAVERDGAALSSAEDLDEDSLRLDPLEAGMDPSERPIGVDKYGTTPYEQRTPRPLDERLAEEEPDVFPDSPTRDSAERAAARDGADEAHGSVAAAARTPEPPD